MSDGVSVQIKITGLDQLRERLLGLPNKLRRRALRNALAAGARLVRDRAREIRRSTSSTSTGAISQYRRHGTVARAITVRTSKVAARAGDVGVFVNVKPLRPGGAHDPNDPFYWRWLEFGAPRINVAARPFLTPAAESLTDALDVIVADLGPQIQKLDTNPNDPL